MSAPITVEMMKPTLLSLDTVREALAATEPLGTLPFSVGSDVYFYVNPGWQHAVDTKEGHELVDVSIALGPSGARSGHQLSKDALLEAVAACGISRSRAVHWPAELLEPTLNHFWRGGLLERRGATRDHQLLTIRGNGAAITKAAAKPFSNLRVLDAALDAIEHRFGKGEVLVDYKFWHDLRRTHLRLIVPEQRRILERTGTDDDAWSVGIQWRSSITGAEKSTLDGYLFRWVCTNGQTDTRAGSGAWTRRNVGEDDEAVYEWARAAVDGVLAGLEPALDAVQGLVDIPIEGEATEVLRDVFAYFKVPVAERIKIIENLVEAGDLTMYTVMNAITQVANDPELDPGHVDNLMRMGGNLVHAAAARCDSCRRLKPHD